MPWNESRPRLNLVLITIECWRADHFGARTPMLAKFGEESAVFAEAQAAGGWTLPSMTALMSSTHASMHGGCFVGLRTPVRKPLAEYLLEEGYWTAGFSSNPTCGSRNGFHRGFADYQNVVSSPPDLPDEVYPHRKDWRQLARMGIRPSATERTATAAQMTDLGLSWIEARDPNAPWFLWLHYTDSHWPYWAPDDSANPAELFELWRDRDLFRTEIHPSRGRYAAREGARTRWLSRYGAALQ